MGCFSFICQKCKQPILSNSFVGQPVKLSLLKDGIIIEEMEGEYDSYGRVFKPGNKESINWSIPWNDVCDLMFHKEKNNGIAAIHSKCDEGEIPTKRSKDDPNQGWGEDMKLMGNVDPDLKL